MFKYLKTTGILVKGIYELWGQGSSYEELEEAIKGFPDERKLPYLTSESTFRIIVDSFGKVMSFQEQNERIKGLSYIPFKVCVVALFSFAVLLYIYRITPTRDSHIPVVCLK